MKTVFKRNVYAEVTQRILAAINSNQTSFFGKMASRVSPRNYVSGRPYTKINKILLSLRDTKTPYYVTFKQAQNLGWRVQKGTGEWIVVYGVKYFLGENRISESQFESLPAEMQGAVRKVPVSSLKTVWNLDYVTGAEDIVANYQKDSARRESTLASAFGDVIQINTTADLIGYDLKSDQIAIPPCNQFSSDAHYESVLARELVHATGHPERLDRLSLITRNSDKNAGVFEDLTGEIGSAFLRQQFGIDAANLTESRFLDEWKSLLAKDQTAVFRAAAEAHRACEWLHQQVEELVV